MNTTHDPIKQAQQDHQAARALQTLRTGGGKPKPATVPLFTLLFSTGLMVLDAVWLYQTKGTKEAAFPGLLLLVLGAYLFWLASDARKA